MTEHPIVKLRQLLESDVQLKKLQAEFAAHPSKHLGEKLERAYYRKHDYINARKTRLAYKPEGILIIRSRHIHPTSIGRSVRVNVYLEHISGGSPLWRIVDTFHRSTAANDKGNEGNRRYRKSLNAALGFAFNRIEYWEPTPDYEAWASKDLDDLPDGYPTALDMYFELD